MNNFKSKFFFLNFLFRICFFLIQIVFIFSQLFVSNSDFFSFFFLFYDFLWSDLIGSGSPTMMTGQSCHCLLLQRGNLFAMPSPVLRSRSVFDWLRVFFSLAPAPVPIKSSLNYSNNFLTTCIHSYSLTRKNSFIFKCLFFT